MFQDKKIIIILGVVAVVLAALVIYVFLIRPERGIFPGLGSAPVGEEELEAERIRTVTGVDENKGFIPLVEGGVIIGVATGSAPIQASPQEPSGEVVGPAPSDLQSEIEEIRRQRTQ